MNEYKPKTEVDPFGDDIEEEEEEKKADDSDDMDDDESESDGEAIDTSEVSESVDEF